MEGWGAIENSEEIGRGPERNAKLSMGVNQRLLYKGRLVLSKTSVLIPSLLHTFHDTIVGGYSGFLRTNKRMSGELH